MPLVSVILTSYNHARFIKEAIESVLYQTFEDFELIIWDDASSDNSWEIIQSYSDPRIRAERNPKNTGPVFGLNKTIFEIAQGKYIAIHHSDDVWELDKLRKQVDFLEHNTNIGAVFTRARIIDEHGLDQDKNWFNHPHKTRWQWLHQIFAGENNLNHPSVLIRKNCYIDLGGYKEALLQTPDAEFWARLLLKFDIHVLHEALTKHRHMHDMSNTSANTLENVIRTENEWNSIRMGIFRSASCEDVFNIFPELMKLRNTYGCNVDFLLAQACLTETVRPLSAHALGIQILYELLLEPASALQLAELYNFDWRAMARVSAQFDSYSVKCHADRDTLTQKVRELESTNFSLTAENSSLTAENSSLSAENSSLSAENSSLSAENSSLTAENSSLTSNMLVRDNQLAAIYLSRSWRITKPLRFLTLTLGKIGAKLPSFSLRDLKSFVSMAKDTPLKAIHNLHEIPRDFDQDAYLKLNPDVAASGVHPKTHYVRHGRHEGRVFSLPPIVLSGEGQFKAGRETLLVVSHEASRTGAPVLSLNLVQALVSRFNVVVLLLGGGPLSETFQQGGVVVVTLSEIRGNPLLANLLVDQLCDRFDFSYALVNSIESRVVLRSLSNNFVPAISLIHEFASYTRPRDAFREVFFWSSDVVFSANITLENALTEFPYLCRQAAHILPQGRCLLPLEDSCEARLEEERNHLRSMIRPKVTDGNSVIILGAGFVQMRKGVDLFVDCAARVIRSPGGNFCRFVWIGKGYDPENDVGYSVYLADQIRRAGLEGHVVFIDETATIETAYEEADLFLLSSRLDPLPNVAIDAMAHGTPVLCFENTTGIADFLNEADLGSHCVAKYLDSAEMAEKILLLAGSPTLRKQVGEKSRSASTAYFSMKGYVSHLEALARKVSGRMQQEKKDTSEIMASGLFRDDFSVPPTQYKLPIEADIRAYVRAWASGIGQRKPFPGFHPGIYLDQHGVAVQGGDPFADYLRSGQPQGNWNYEVIIAGEVATIAKSLPENQRVALHLHVYYPELLPEITSRLSLNRILPDLFVSIPNDHARDLVTSHLKDYKGNIIDIQRVPNRGRDIGPLITAFGRRIIDDYDFVGHFHTKKTADVKDAAMGKLWYEFLLENLIGGISGAMADSVLSRMKDDESIGMVFADDPYIVAWGENRTFAESIAARMGTLELPDNFIFPIGTMFWARTSALTPLVDLKLDWEDYPTEPLPYDGSLLHAIERLFSVILSFNNLRSATTNVIGLTR